MNSSPAGASAPTRPGISVGLDYSLFLNCVHCGLCTSACPTYLETGSEPDSPRGRIYLMRAVADGRAAATDATIGGHLDLCLDCRACESACPSGVQYGRILEAFRANTRSRSPGRGLSALQRFLVLGLTPYPGRLRPLLRLVRLSQRLRLETLAERTGLMRLLPESLRSLRDLLPLRRPLPGPLPEFLPAIGKRRGRIALFLGCAADVFFPETSWATAKVLQHNGCDVLVPRAQVCCGALHRHAGAIDAAQRFAEANCTAFGPALREPVDAVVVSAAGCGVMLKEYDRVLANGAAAAAGRHLAARVRDVSEYLADLGPVPPPFLLRLRAVYHDACHLAHGQQIRRQPRELLALIPGLELLPLAEGEVCCGAAGSYNLTEPGMAERLGRRKAGNIQASGARAVFAGNVGCLLQIGRHLRAEQADVLVAHPIDALWAAYCGTPSSFAR